MPGQVNDCSLSQLFHGLTDLDEYEQLSGLSTQLESQSPDSVSPSPLVLGRESELVSDILWCAQARVSGSTAQAPLLTLGEGQGSSELRLNSAALPSETGERQWL